MLSLLCCFRVLVPTGTQAHCVDQAQRGRHPAAGWDHTGHQPGRSKHQVSDRRCSTGCAPTGCVQEVFGYRVWLLSLCINQHARQLPDGCAWLALGCLLALEQPYDVNSSINNAYVACVTSSMDSVQVLPVPCTCGGQAGRGVCGVEEAVLLGRQALRHQALFGPCCHPNSSGCHPPATCRALSCCCCCRAGRLSSGWTCGVWTCCSW